MIDALLKYLAGDAAQELEGLRFAFNVPFDQPVAWALLLFAASAAALFFWPKLARLGAPTRALLIVLRAAAAVAILFLLFDPCIVGKRVRRTDRAVLLLFDDSRSMQVAGPNDQTRGQRLIARYQEQAEEFERKLRDHAQLVFCRFGEALDRVRSPQNLGFEQSESDLTGAVEMALGDFAGAEVAAVALFTDGVQQAPGHPIDWPALERLDVPVFTVGVGADEQWRDLSLGPLAVKRADLDRQPVTVKAPLRAVGLRGREAIVEILIDGSTLKTERLKIDADAAELEARLEFVPPKPGWLECEVRARLAKVETPKGETAPPGERIAQNNTRRFLIDNRDKTYRILYLCGRPNWENKFIRRALEEDKRLKLTSLVRISGPERTFKYRGSRSSLANPIFEGAEPAQDAPRYDEALFLRFGVKGSELSLGYPERPADLFPYHLVVWGEIEADFFSQAQLEVTREYIRKRGGGLLLLGGRHSFSEGGFAKTAIESLLPARLLAPERDGPSDALDPAREFQTRPTLEGALSGAWALDPNPEVNQFLWDEMPPLRRINQFALTRPGAAVHAHAIDPDSDRDPRPLFAIQRYGEGRCAILATGSTWQWRLGAEKDDRKHERLWRQIIRGQVRQSLEPVRLRAAPERFTIGESADLQFSIRDNVFDEREGLNVAITATAPSGGETTLPVEESIQEAGIYACEYEPREPGMHRLSLAALDDEGKTVGEMEQAVLAEADWREFEQAQYNPAFLREIAQRTGGAFFPLDKMSELPDAIRWRPSERAEEARIHLWRLPGFFILLAALTILEWYLRRKRGYR